MTPGLANTPPPDLVLVGQGLPMTPPLLGNPVGGQGGGNQFQCGNLCLIFIFHCLRTTFVNEFFICILTHCIFCIVGKSVVRLRRRFIQVYVDISLGVHVFFPLSGPPGPHHRHPERGGHARHGAHVRLRGPVGVVRRPVQVTAAARPADGGAAKP